jgi:peptidyl-prolyl cis-trans isomerase B (cyclophilin B)
MWTRLLPALIVISIGIACGGGEGTPAETEPPPAEPHALSAIRPGPHDELVLDMGELGVIRIELLPELAPNTVAHFAELTDQGFYDGTYFHRVIPEFMIQGGDPNTKDRDPRNDGKGRTERIEDEFTDYPHLRGTLSMANTGHSNSSSCQFFIVHQDRRDLDGSFTAFGRVTSGIEVVDAITELEIDTYGRYGPTNRPYPVSATIEKAWIERAKAAVATTNPRIRTARPRRVPALDSTAVAR